MKRSEPDGQFEALLEFLKSTRGFDFTGYKRASVGRRIRKRMHEVSVRTFADYQDYLEVHPEEYSLLFDTILINVTGFYRDPQAWDFLSETIIPRILQESKAPVRVWSAGCSSGEEAYTLALTFAEALGHETFCQRVKIYATDVDEAALSEARTGSYSEKQVQPIPEKYLEKYFSHSANRYIFRPELRRCVIFGRHDLIQDAPISRLDLLVCRNTIMYFNAETQRRILERFHFALQETGFLFLGRAEMFLTHSGLFAPFELKHRVFSKLPRDDVREALLPLADMRNEEESQRTSGPPLVDRAFDTQPVAQLVVDAKGTLVLANEMARNLLGLDTKDVGRPFADLELSYRPTELRSRVEQAHSEKRTLQIPDVQRVIPNGNVQHLVADLTPLREGDRVLGISIAFQDVTEYQHLKTEHEHAMQELETAYEELQSTNEELETTNEELQSTNEELETTNEELQSTNEEMETMNEELQSTNEELDTVNTELRNRTEELNQTNLFLESILASLRVAVVVLDRKLNVERWNKKAEDLWGLRADEVHGHNLLNLDIGLPVEKLKGPLHACLAEHPRFQDLVLDAIDRRGKRIVCNVAFSPLVRPEGVTQGIILLISEAAAPSEQASTRRRS